MKTLILLSLLLLAGCRQEPVWAEVEYTNEQIANAIYKAEGGVKTKHPYGILAKYKTTSPRQACLNTIRNQKVRHAKHNCGKEFLVCLRDRYCPLKANNDPTGLNANWLRNVRRFLING